jgi:hypothetical protein
LDEEPYCAAKVKHEVLQLLGEHESIQICLLKVAEISSGVADLRN